MRNNSKTSKELQSGSGNKNRAYSVIVFLLGLLFIVFADKMPEEVLILSGLLLIGLTLTTVK